MSRLVRRSVAPPSRHAVLPEHWLRLLTGPRPASRIADTLLDALQASQGFVLFAPASPADQTVVLTRRGLAIEEGLSSAAIAAARRGETEVHPGNGQVVQVLALGSQPAVIVVAAQ